MTPVLWTAIAEAARAIVGSLARASLWGGVFAILVLATTRLVPRLSAATRCALWWLVSLKFVIGLVWFAPIELPVLSPPAFTPPTIAVAQAHNAPAAAASGHPRPSSTPFLPPDVWPVVAALLWAATLALLLGLSARHARRAFSLIRLASAAPDATKAMAAELAAALGLAREVEVRVSPDVDTPLVGGMVRPVVLLPEPGFDALPAAQQRMALCHELAHVRRADLWLNAIPALAERVFFFHPLAHVAAREFGLAREAACDAAVLRTLHAAPSEYGQLLLALGVARQSRHLAAAGAPRSLSNLRRRISMLNQSSSSRAWRLVSWGIAALAVCAIVPIQLVARRSAPAPVAAQSLGAQRPAPAALPVATTQASLPSPPPTLAGSPELPAMGQPSSKDLAYVLFMDDSSMSTSGSTADVARAKSLRKNGERLLWFRREGKEYVVRDAALMRQVEEVFKPVQEIGGQQGEIGERQGKIGERQGKIGAQQGAIGEKQGEIGERQGKIGEQQRAIGEKQGEIGAKQGDIGAAQAKIAQRELEIELERTRGKVVDAQVAKLERQRRDTEKQMEQLNLEMEKLSQEMRKLDEPMAQASLDMDKLSQAMRKLDEPMAQANLEMEKLSQQMNELSRTMAAASAKAESDSRALLGRAVASGSAVPVK